MPGLDTDMHVKMLRNSRAFKTGKGTYGLEWGDPNALHFLSLVRVHYLSYYINQLATVVEIGPGGGRWTRYMRRAKRVYAVDYHQEILDELARKHVADNLVFVKNNGTDFPGIPDEEVDFLFSFGTFVHLDLDLIEAYLTNMKRLLKPTSNVVIHYSDKTKPMAQRNLGFSENTPEIMLKMVRGLGYNVQDDNRWLLAHSSIVRFTL